MRKNFRRSLSQKKKNIFVENFRENPKINILVSTLVSWVTLP